MAGLVGADGDAAEALDVILQLLRCLLLVDGEEGTCLVIDPSFVDGRCSDETRTLLEHLWATLINWTMRSDPPDEGPSLCLSVPIDALLSTLPRARPVHLACVPSVEPFPSCRGRCFRLGQSRPANAFIKQKLAVHVEILR